MSATPVSIASAGGWQRIDADSSLVEGGLRKSDQRSVDAIGRSETDLAMSIATGRADVGLGIEALARQFQLEFTPMVVERFDLLVWRKAFFDPPFKKLVRFCSSAQFQERARASGVMIVPTWGPCISTARNEKNRLRKRAYEALGLERTSNLRTGLRRSIHHQTEGRRRALVADQTERPRIEPLKTLSDDDRTHFAGQPTGHRHIAAIFGLLCQPQR